MASIKWRARLGEKRANVWVLLSDTDRFLSRAKLLPRYERRLREWRRRLQEGRGDVGVEKEIRGEIAAVRRALREEGWELRLGSLDVAVKGFRQDDSMAQGFRRMVLYLAADGGIHYITGTANHITLDDELRDRLRAARIGGALEPHYLWYRIADRVIELAGADSEPRDSFDRFKETVENRKSDLVKALAKLR